MNWKETLVFPPEIPISPESRNLIQRYIFLRSHSLLALLSFFALQLVKLNTAGVDQKDLSTSPTTRTPEFVYTSIVIKSSSVMAGGLIN